jgi:hypothetical protein
MLSFELQEGLDKAYSIIGQAGYTLSVFRRHTRIEICGKDLLGHDR